MTAVKTYDPHNVQIIMGGFAISGFADGTFISVAYDEDAYNKTVGADGEVSRARSNNQCATVTLTLKQTSNSNDDLSALFEFDKVNDAGIVPLMVKEIGSGRTLMFTQAAWVQRAPDVNYSKDVEDRAWTVATGQISTFIGGNAPSGSAGE